MNGYLWFSRYSGNTYKELLKVGSVLKVKKTNLQPRYGQFIIHDYKYLDEYLTLSRAAGFMYATFYWFHNKELFRSGFRYQYVPIGTKFEFLYLKAIHVEGLGAHYVSLTHAAQQSIMGNS